MDDFPEFNIDDNFPVDDEELQNWVGFTQPVYEENKADGDLGVDVANFWLTLPPPPPNPNPANVAVGINVPMHNNDNVNIIANLPRGPNVDGQQIFVGLIPQPQPVGSALADNFLNWYTSYQSANPNSDPNEILRIGLYDLSRFRHREMQAILRGGNYNPGGEAGNRIALNPFQDSNFLSEHMIGGVRRSVHIDNIPPIFSQISWSLFDYLFGSTLDEVITDHEDVGNFVMGVLEGTSFKLPEYLVEVLRLVREGNEGVFLLTQFSAIDLFADELADVYAYREYGSFYDDADPWHILYRHFHKMAEMIADLMGEYDAFENENVLSVWLKNWELTLRKAGGLTLENLTAFATFPIALSEKYAFRAPLISSGFCTAETFWWITEGTKFQSRYWQKNVNTPFDLARRLFLEWLARCAYERPQEFDMWASGKLSILRDKLFQAGILFQMIEVETLRLHTNTGVYPIEVPPHGDEVKHAAVIRHWIAKHIDPFAPVIVFNAHHCFEIEYTHLQYFMFKLVPDHRWKTTPIAPRRFRHRPEKRSQKAVRVPKQSYSATEDNDDDEIPRETNSFRDAAFDIECYTDPKTLIQHPYLIVFKELWVGGETLVYRKKDDNDDVMERFRFDLWYRYIDGIHRDPKSVARGHYCGNSPRICKHVKDSLQRLRVFSHNGCKYDLIYFLNSTLLDSVAFLGNAVNFKMITWGNIVFVDFFNFFSTSLDKLAKSWLGIGKADHPDFKLITSETWHQYIDIMEDYCRKDVNILGELVTRFLAMVADFGLVDPDAPQGRWKLEMPMRATTAASLAVSIWKDIFNTEWINPCPKDQFHKFRLGGALRGGWCQIFIKNPTPDQYPIKVYDYNSAYPAIMKDCYMPVNYISTIPLKNMRLQDWLKSPQARKTSPATLYLYGVSGWNVKSSFKMWHIAQRVDGDGLYYTRNFAGRMWVWGCEIEPFVDMADITIFEVNVWEGKKIFTSFIDYLYKIKADAKREGNTPMESFAKLLMNSLYGKLCQHEFPQTVLAEVGRVYEILKARGLLENVQSIKKISNTHVMAKLKLNPDDVRLESDGRMLHISSMVTARQREKMMSDMRAFGLEHIAYCDTDSFFVTNGGNVPLDRIDEYELGKLKCEAVIPKTFVGLAAKLYAYVKEDKTPEGKLVMKAKGIPAKYLDPAMYSLGPDQGDEGDEVNRPPISLRKEWKTLPLLSMRRFQFSLVALEIPKVISFVYNRRIWHTPASSDLYPDVITAVTQRQMARTEAKARRVKGKPARTVFSESADMISRQALAKYPLAEVETFAEFISECSEIRRWLEDYIGVIRLRRREDCLPEVVEGLLNNLNIPRKWKEYATRVFNFLE